MLQDQSRNRTPMPGAQALAAAPPDTGPARAEAGIAAMLSKPEPEFVRVSQAALIEALSGDVSAALRAAIEDHAHALKVGADDSDHSDEAFDRHSARQNETDENLRSVRCQSLSDLRAKLTYLIPIFRPDLLDQRVGDHLEGLLADVDAMSQAQAEPERIGEDPIFAALAESRRLYAEWMGAYDAWPHGSIEPPAVLARMNAGCRAFMDHLKETVLETIPTSLAGCASLGRYVMELFDREEIDGDEHGRAGLHTITEGLRALPVEPASTIDEPVDTVKSPVIAAILNHENARRRSVEGSVEAADEDATAAGESDQAWRDLFRQRPQSLHQIWLLLQHVEKHHAAHQSITDAPDTWGTLTGAVAAIRTASKSPKVPPHDLSKLSVVQLSRLYEVCRQQREILLTVEECSSHREPNDRVNPLGTIMEAEGERFGFLGDDVICELERRRPDRESERDLVLEARVRHYMSCGEVFDAKLIADIAATWGAK